MAFNPYWVRFEMVRMPASRVLQERGLEAKKQVDLPTAYSFRLNYPMSTK